MNPAIWQISGAPEWRSYTKIFLKHGVALIGPGYTGKWALPHIPEREGHETPWIDIARQLAPEKGVGLLIASVQAATAVG